MNKLSGFLVLSFLLVGCGKNGVAPTPPGGGKPAPPVAASGQPSPPPAPGSTPLKSGQVDPWHAGAALGQETTVVGTPVSVGNSSGDIYLNFGGDYPKQVFVAVIPAADLSKFPVARTLLNKEIRVSGKVEKTRNNTPMIRLTNPDQLKQ